MKKIDASDGAVFLRRGYFIIFLSEQVKSLVCAMAKAFPNGRLVFDSAGKTAVKMIAKTWIKQAEIKDVNAFFYVSDAEKELSKWGKNINVSSRGYMLGYSDLKYKSVGTFFRLLAKLGDNIMKMKIVRLDFTN
ncbi:MAG: hypothetical protein L6V93_05085 [Clostridiales bacterium]|nr:MAG: hypothetical protein L6V93_05085 [Clostridiales bacterium]